MQAVTLLFEQRVQPDFGAIKNRTAEILHEEIQSSSAEDTDRTFLIFYTEHVIEYSDRSAPAQTAFIIPGEEKTTTDYTEQIQQSWHFSDAADTVKQAKFDFAIIEFMARTLNPKTRLKLFHAALQAAVEVCQPIALVFGPLGLVYVTIVIKVRFGMNF